MDVKTNPNKDIAALVALRNGLTHFKPEWDDEAKRHKELSNKLQGHFAPSPFLPDQSLFPAGGLHTAAPNGPWRVVSRFATSSGDWLALTQNSTHSRIDLLRKSQQPWLTAHLIFKPGAVVG
jgi:hypothetical protein